MLRFAPSPTGDMHIGNLRAAILNYIIAKQRGEKFLIRIEDTDKARNIDGADKEILQILNLFGLFWDKLVHQSDNFKIHNDLAKRLVAQGQAFYCYATKEFLDKKRDEALAQKKAFRYDDSWAEVCKSENKNPAIRLKGDLGVESISFTDEIKGTCTFSQNEIDSFVIIRDDGVPTYNFACAVDDMIYDISFIIRGEDHTSNTPKQILVHKKLGYGREIKYAHLPIILNDSGKKMSKRESESSVKWLLEQGFLPRAILNYLLLMGNNPPTEIFSLDDAIKWFDLSQLSKSPVRFDMNQLRHINREHLRRLSENEMGLLLESSSEILSQVGNLSLGKHQSIPLPCEVKSNLSPLPCGGGLGVGKTKKAPNHRQLAPYMKEFSREMRKNPTDAENKLWQELRDKKLGFGFRRQFVIDSKYIADFVCLEKRLIIECDGGQHNQFQLPHPKPHPQGEGLTFNSPSLAEGDKGGGYDKINHPDIQRDFYLESQNFRILRFWNNEILENLEGVLLIIKEALESDFDFAKSTHPLAPSAREGEQVVSNSTRDRKSNDPFLRSLGALGHIFLEESSTLNEIRAKIERIFAPKAISDEFRIYGAEIAILKSTLLDLIEDGDEAINDFNALKGKLGDSCKVNDKPLKGKGLFMPLRFLLTGAGSGPHLDILYPHLRAHLAIILRFKED